MAVCTSTAAVPALAAGRLPGGLPRPYVFRRAQPVWPSARRSFYCTPLYFSSECFLQYILTCRDRIKRGCHQHDSLADG